MSRSYREIWSLQDDHRPLRGCAIPNWCSNKLTIRGKPELLQSFYEENAIRRTPEEFEKLSRSKGDDHRRVVACVLSFEKSIPTPPEFKDKPSPPPGHKMVPNELTLLLEGKLPPYDWYTWRIINWGTKWDPGDETEAVLNYDKRQIQYKFDTAWSPPTAWLLTISKKYPRLVFFLEYEEGGNNFEGVLLIKEGVVIAEKEGPYTRCGKCNERGCDCTPAQKRGEE